MEIDSLDLISELPQSVLESILAKLPIRDAVRTSILSTKWRYKWAALTDIVFDDKSAIQFSDRALVQHGIENFITRLLLLHDGPIHKFSLSSSYLMSSPDILQWLLFVSRKGVKELVIELGDGQWFKAPSCLFSCKKLTRLELVRCELNPPPDFKGFPCLKSLSLQQVLFSPEEIESLISSCPLLESLSLSYFDSLVLKIHAPNLKHLILEGEFKELCLVSTPLLVDLSVALYMTDDIAEHIEQHGILCYFDLLFAGVPKLEKLIGHIYFTKYLSLANDLTRSPIIYSHLKSIELYQVGFDDLREVLVVLHLITTAPVLEDLQISGSSNSSNSSAVFDASDNTDVEIWDWKDWADHKLQKLKTVTLIDMSGAPQEMKLIQYLLEHSPALEHMSIRPSLYVTDGRVNNILIQFLSFRRASPLASVAFAHDPV